MRDEIVASPGRCVDAEEPGAKAIGRACGVAMAMAMARGTSKGRPRVRRDLDEDGRRDEERGQTLKIEEGQTRSFPCEQELSGKRHFTHET